MSALEPAQPTQPRKPSVAAPESDAQTDTITRLRQLRAVMRVYRGWAALARAEAETTLRNAAAARRQARERLRRGEAFQRQAEQAYQRALAARAAAMTAWMRAGGAEWLTDLARHLFPDIADDRGRSLRRNAHATPTVYPLAQAGAGGAQDGGNLFGVFAIEGHALELGEGRRPRRGLSGIAGVTRH